MRALGVISLLLAALAAGYFGSQIGAPANVAKSENHYERILRTNEIRCGYSLWQPLFFVDPNTKTMSGIFYDLMEEVGRRLKLKIIWAEEIGWGTIVESVKSDKIDMACAGYWLHPSRIRNVSSTAPQFYAPLYIWVRADENRFQTIADLNSPDVTVSLIDGGSQTQIMENTLPRAKPFNMPETATNGDQIEALLTGKADVMIDDITSFMAYDQAKPGKLKLLFPNQPLATFPATMLLPPDEPRLKEMIDNMLLLIELDGTLDKILKRYHADTVFLRRAGVGAR